MEATLNQTAVKEITMVAISAIRPNGFNPRKHFDEASLNELADSIRQQGMLQPVTVRPTADNGYGLVFGERRYRAATIVGMQEIPAIISDLSDEEAEEIAITENLQGKDVHRPWRADGTIYPLSPCSSARARHISVHG